MANKVIIGILALLVILTGSAGYYSYTLSRQISDLSERLTAFEIEQTARTDAVSEKIVDLRDDTLSGFSTVEGQIEESMVEITALEAKLDITDDQISDLEDEIGNAELQIESLGDRITDTEAKTGSLFDAREVYQEVSQATVRISDGQNTIGSGVIYDSNGHVLTAHHVINGLSTIYVMMHDGSVSRAAVTGYCQFSDIAVLELDDIPSITPPPLADTGMIEIGEPVVALGSPLDLKDTLTAGIISQINRYTEIQYETESSWIPNLLQFDAAVNAGNSGCPLANKEGEIVGIVIARVGPLTGDGIYYAVAANKAKRVAEAIIAEGSFNYPWVGVGISDITPVFAEEFSLETYNGVFVGSVFGDSPAEGAGMEIGDIIFAMDGEMMRNSAELTSYLGEFKSPGDEAIITVLRDNREIEIQIEIGTR